MGETVFTGIESWQSRTPSDSAVVLPSRPHTATTLEGEPMPYLLRSDVAITGIFLMCFFLLAVVLGNNRKYIAQRLKNLFIQRERVSLFDETSDAIHGYSVILSTLTCVLAGVGLYRYFLTAEAYLIDRVPHFLLLAVYVICVIVFVLLKWGFYNFINWIFFDREQKESWSKTLFDLTGGACFLLFPVLLLSVYLNLNFQISNYFMLFVLLVSELVLFYKCIRNFFSQIHGFLHFIMYFCALEVVPLILFWEAINGINSILILNY